MDPDMTLAAAQVQMIHTMVPVMATQATQICMNQDAAWPPVSNKATCCGPDPGPPGLSGDMGHRLQHRPQCDRTTDLDTVFSSSLGLNVIMALGADEVNPAGMSLVAVRPSDTNMIPDGSPDPRNQPKEF